MTSLALASFLFVSCPPAEEKAVSVTVVIVMATDQNKNVHPKLKALAREVQKHDPKLTGFRLVATECKSIPVGATANINLTDKQVLKVAVNKPKDKDGRITLTLYPPRMDEVNYACACDKFFPIVTPHRTKKGEQLIIAVMAKPCTGKKK